jgi:beta-mannosidase
VDKASTSVSVTVEVSLAELNASNTYKILVDVVGNGSHKGTYDVPKGNTTCNAQIGVIVNKPILWWTRDVGTPYLYNVSVTVQENGQNVISNTVRHGIRTVNVSQTPDKSGNGSEFTVILNNVSIFMRGGNYIPPDMFMPRALKNPSVYHKTI